MSPETFNLVLGLSLAGISFAFTFKWVLGSYLEYKLLSKGRNIPIQMDAEEFEKYVKSMEEGDDDDFIGRR